MIGVGATGASLSLGLSLPFAARLADATSTAPAEINAWVVIDPDDTVTIRIARSEMGQGTLTGLAQLVAEELECDWNKVTWAFPTPGQNVARERIWRDFSTGGSQGLRGSQEYVRQGGAAARTMLIQAAANEWKAAPADCVAKQSVITHKPSGRTVTFGKVAAAAAKLPVPENVPLKDPSTWTIAGKPLKRLDTPDKLTGKLVYGADIKLPGMLNASIKDCPVLGGKLKSYDESKVRSMPGVKGVVKVETASGTNGVAVVADTWWQAHKALEALPVEWDVRRERELRRCRADEATRKRPRRAGSVRRQPQRRREGRVCVGGSHGGGRVQGAVAESRDDGADERNRGVDEGPLRGLVSHAERRSRARGGVRSVGAADRAVRRVQDDPRRRLRPARRSGLRAQAVVIAKAFPGTPIKLLWSREEDQMHGFFHPTTMAKMRGSLDADGNLTALHMRVSGQSILAALAPQRLVDGADFATFQGVVQGGLNPAMDQHAMSYDFANVLVDHAMRNPPIRPGFWRGVNVNQNAVYLESFMDELAHAAGRDPLEFRLAHLKKNPKSGRGAQGRAEKSGWGSKDGKARGLAATLCVRQLRRGVRRRHGERRGCAACRSHRGGNGLRHGGQSAADRSAGARLVRLRPVRGALQPDHVLERPGQRTQLRHLSVDAHRGRCRTSRRSSCRRADSSAASASRRSVSRRRRCSMRSSRRPARAFVRCRSRTRS